MKNIFYLFVVALLIHSCQDSNALLSEIEPASNSNTGELEQRSDGNLYPIERVLEYIQNDELKDWKDFSDPRMIYSIGMYWDSTFLIGYKPQDLLINGNLEMSTVDMNSGTWQNAKSSILNQVANMGAYENKTPELGEKLPILRIKTGSFEIIEGLMNSEQLYFIEPPAEEVLMLMANEASSYRDKVRIDYQNYLASMFSCKCEEEDPVNSNDYSIISPNVKQSWHHAYHNIDQNVWNTSTGQGIGIAFIDTGVSEDQENLDQNGSFNSGDSQGRTETRINFLDALLEERSVLVPAPSIGGGFEFRRITIPVEVEYDAGTISPHDRCGHGTTMAGLAAAPRGNDGNAVGIAYNCNLYNFRAVHNPVIITNFEKMAVAEALFECAISLNSDIRVVSMSIGQLPYMESPMIQMALQIAYDHDLLLVAAAGTFLTDAGSLSGIVFPGNSPLTISATGIKIPSSYPNELDENTKRCHNCISGSTVDFSFIMEREADEPTAVSIGCDGEDPLYTAGSSTATASTSAMAALLWSDLGSLTPRDDIVSALEIASSNYNNDHPQFGKGWVDMQLLLQ